MKTRTYSKNIADAINTFLTEDDWNFSFNENKGIFKFSFGPFGEIRTINYIVLVREDNYDVDATLSLGADINNEQQLMSMAEFVCRANYGLIGGVLNLTCEMARSDIATLQIVMKSLLPKP